MKRDTLIIFIVLVLGLTGLLVWLIHPVTGPIQVQTAHDVKVASDLPAQLTVDLQNRWQDRQLAFCETSVETTETGNVARAISLQPDMPRIAVQVLGPTDRVSLLNNSKFPLTYQLVDLMDPGQKPFGHLVLPGGKSLAFVKSDYFHQYGVVLGLLEISSQKLDAIFVYLPNNLYVLGEEGKKTFALPNQRLRWRWLRFADDAREPWGLKVLSTEHEILVNEGKPLTLSFETPLREKPKP